MVVEHINMLCKSNNKQVFVLIDEYDNFVRIFMTGVRPIMLDDLTSGFNITRNYTLDRNLNAMLGFTRDEISSIMDKVGLLVDRFNIQTMYSEKENFKSLLFYLGMLTIKEKGPIGTVSDKRRNPIYSTGQVILPVLFEFIIRI
ncbi:AAA family ATPase [Clostridium estertheticum]|nr:AAA family ATPase [Clostridium estertheticum]